MEIYFSGEKLYGDDFNLDDIKSWYNDEAEGYYHLSKNTNNSIPSYGYHVVNGAYAFKYLKNKKFVTALGFGAAYGKEFEPIIDKIEKLYIIDASKSMHSSNIGSLKPIYEMSNVNGSINFSNNTFDLITCLGVLHHIPNVSFVLSELYRVLKPNGIFILREPIVSMGDWRLPRKGLTVRERGIPIKLLDNALHTLGFSTIKRSFLFTSMSFANRMIGRHLKKPLYEYKLYVYFDKMLSFFLASNNHYHPQNIIQKIAPASVYYVLTK